MSFHKSKYYLFNVYQHQLLFCPYANKWPFMSNWRIPSHQKPYNFITQTLICKIIAPNISMILLNSKYTSIKTYITLKYFFNNYFQFFANFVIFHLKMLIKSKSYRIRLAITFFLIRDSESFPKRYDSICHQEWYRHLVWLMDYEVITMFSKCVYKVTHLMSIETRRMVPFIHSFIQKITICCHYWWWSLFCYTYLSLQYFFVIWSVYFIFITLSLWFKGQVS